MNALKIDILVSQKRIIDGFSGQLVYYDDNLYCLSSFFTYDPSFYKFDLNSSTPEAEFLAPRPDAEAFISAFVEANGVFYYLSDRSYTTPATFYKYDIGTVGINDSDLNNSNLVIYPNPSSNFLKINNLKANIKGEIINIHGQAIKEFEILPNSNKIDVSFLSKGTYFVRLDNKSNMKFIKF